MQSSDEGWSYRSATTRNGRSLAHPVLIADDWRRSDPRDKEEYSRSREPSVSQSEHTCPGDPTESGLTNWGHVGNVIRSGIVREASKLAANVLAKEIKRQVIAKQRG